ncbi:MAG: D-alanine--D-alanine ligase [Elusimicrobiaceae bacterium]|nr:D-alanine--D-alanine ligase [Elusimicrobiaceae bacterium]
MTEKQLCVAVLYGGKSAEHDISIQSGTTICRLAGHTGFGVVPVYIDREGRWFLQTEPGGSNTRRDRVLPVPGSGRPALISHDTGRKGLHIEFDVAFPILHGPMGEDGTLQGLLELCSIPYAGCGVLASAAGMDKEVCKRLAQSAGVAVLPHVTLHRETWSLSAAGSAALEFGYPVFVKPLCMGSSVGITRVTEPAALETAVAKAFRYDSRVMIERGVDHAREIMCGLLGSGADCKVSVCGEIGAIAGEFFDYNAKYESAHGFDLPANIPPETAALARDYALKVFSAIRGEGFARADFLLDPKTGNLFFGEINTAPGFTPNSLYPQLFNASGVSPAQAVRRLIELAAKRQNDAKLVSVTR